MPNGWTTKAVSWRPWRGATCSGCSSPSSGYAEDNGRQADASVYGEKSTASLGGLDYVRRQLALVLHVQEGQSRKEKL